MKTKFYKLFGILTLSATFATSCTTDNEMKNQSSTFVADANNFTGTINDGDYP
jgi:hypothetical protein